MQDKRAKYFGSHTRLQLHAEAICAYQGQAAERSIIEQAYDAYAAAHLKAIDFRSWSIGLRNTLFRHNGRSFGQGAYLCRRRLSFKAPCSTQFREWDARLWICGD